VLVSPKKTVEFPVGYIPSMLAASFFDDNAIVFSTDDHVVHLYSKSSGSLAIEVESNIVRIESADLDCYERCCLCLTEHSQLLAIHFSSQTISVISDDARDFCVCRSPFDTVVVFSNSGNLSLPRFKDRADLHGSIRSAIDALDSRMVAGIAAVSDLRRRLTLRRNLAEKSPIGLPAMTTLFGTKPMRVEIEETDFSSPSLWIENLNGLSFEIHCSIEFPHSCDVVLASDGCSFVASCVNSLIGPTVMSVIVEMVVERMGGYSPFRVFLRNAGVLHFAGAVEFDVGCLIESKGIRRIAEQYFVSFPQGFSFTTCPFPGCEVVDNGVILTVEADSIEKFEQAMVRANVGFPEGAVFQRKEKTHYQVQVARELVKYINRFFLALDSSETGKMAKSVLIEMKSTLNDLLACILW
jgi:hypothetical protein